MEKYNCYGNFKLIMNDLDNKDADILKIIGFTYLGEPIYSIEFIARVSKDFLGSCRGVFSTNQGLVFLT